MFWIIVLVVLAILLFNFQKNKENLNNSIAEQGGMVEKYNYIVDVLLDYPGARIIELKSNCLIICVEDKFVITHFKILQSFNSYEIYWDHKSTTFVHHKLNWSFPEYMSHTSAINLVANEINDYSNNMFNKIFR